MSLVLHQFKPLYGMPNASPFCVKLETYLRLAQLPYTVVTLKRPPSSATGKAPFIEMDGRTIHNFRLIIDHLERTHGHKVDGKLTLAQRAKSLALQRLMEEHLYWVEVYARWVDPANDANTYEYMRSLLGLPGFIMKPVAALLRRGIRGTLHHHGLGRHPPEVVWQMGAADVRALAHWLGNRPFGFGDTPTVVDACLFAFIGCILCMPWEFPLKTITAKHGNLVAHKDRMMQRCFPELVPAN